MCFQLFATIRRLTVFRRMVVAFSPRAGEICWLVGFGLVMVGLYDVHVQRVLRLCVCVC